jgi:NAD(P)H-nitrite reductase large subunit
MADKTGAIRQRDGGRYAVVTRMPAGIVRPEDLETVATIARKFNVPMLKITSGQRIALVGIEPEDVAKVIDELGPLAKPETAPCVKFVQACLGTEMCRYGNQDAIGLARAIDERFKTVPSRQKSR